MNALLRSEKFDIAHNEVYFGGGINLYAAKEMVSSKELLIAMQRVMVNRITLL